MRFLKLFLLMAACCGYSIIGESLGEMVFLHYQPTRIDVIILLVSWIIGFVAICLLLHVLTKEKRVSGKEEG